jgi:hypothetical protein
MIKTAGKHRTVLLIALTALSGFCCLGGIAGVWLVLHLVGIQTSLWAMIESLFTAIAVVVAVVGAILVYTDTARDRHRDVADRLFQEMNSDASIEARRAIYQELPEYSEQAANDLAVQMREAIKRTLNSLDRAGFMIQSGWIPEQVILPWISPMVVKVWNKLEPYVEHEVQRRQEPDYYRAARRLARCCVEWRKKNVPDAQIRWHKDAI